MRTLALVLTPLAAFLPSCLSAESYTAKDAQDGAQLRSDIGVAATFLFSPCVNGPTLKQARERFEQLKEAQTSYPRMIDFAVAQADYDYGMSLVDINCPDLDEEQQADGERLEAELANTTMDRIEDVLKDLAEKGE